MRITPSSKAELVIHPVRLRIFQAIGQRQMTPSEIGSLLKDVPQASLYRHLKLLKEGGIIQVVGQNMDSAIPESVYSAVEGGAHITREEFAEIAPEEHKRFYAIFLGTLTSAVNDYFEDPSYDTTRDGMTYFTANLSLTDEQRRQLRLDLLGLATKYGQFNDSTSRNTKLGVSLTPEPHTEQAK